MTNETQRKLKVYQVSGNIAPNMGGDFAADSFLKDQGFGDERNPYGFGLYIGCKPLDGKAFFVYYQEPAKKDERGSFKLVRLEEGIEKLVDEGTASESHIHGGLGTITFYGEGRAMPSWSFHCKIPQEDTLTKKQNL
jgi:hypothetical protein